MFFKVIFLAFLSTVLADLCWDAPLEETHGGTLQLCPYGCCNEYHTNPCCSVPVGLIVGVVIGIIAFIAIVVVAIVCCVRRRSYTRTQMTYVNGVPQTHVITTSQQPGGVVYGGPQAYYAPPAAGYAPQQGGYAPQPAGDAPQPGGYAPQACGPQATPTFDGPPTKN